MRPLKLSCVLVLLAALASCDTTNSLYCDETTSCTDSIYAFCDIDGAYPGSPGANSCIEAPSAEACNRMSPCTDPAAPVCDDDSMGVCVACTDDSHCDGDLAVCSDANVCVACLDDSHCNGDLAVCSDANVCVACLDDSQCDGDLGYCSEGSSCVGCLVDEHCADGAVNAQICDLGDSACRGCEANEECGSRLCGLDTDGVCVDESDVLYVDGTTGSDVVNCGTTTNPCKSISKALLARTSARSIILVAEGDYPEQLSISGGEATLIAEGLVRVTPALANENDVALLVANAAVVTVTGFVVAPGPSNDDTDAVYCTDQDTSLTMTDSTMEGAMRLGVSSRLGCQLALDNSIIQNNGSGGLQTASFALVTGGAIRNNSGIGVIVRFGVTTLRGVLVHDNTSYGVGASGLAGTPPRINIEHSTIRGNPGGGVLIYRTNYFILNNMITNNGSATSDTGGVLVAAGVGQMSFNTIAGNQRRDGVGFAIMCLNNDIADNNILMLADGSTASAVDGCNTKYSLIDSNSTDNTGNHPNAIYANVTFVDAAAGDYHLEAGSPGIDVAGPVATLATDFDGDARPQGVRRDIGADEFVVD